MRAVPTQTMLKLVIFGGGLVLFVLLAILPARKESEALDLQIKSLQNRIAEQRTLSPIYETLLKKTQMEPPGNIKLIESRPLNREAANQVVDLFNQLAEKSRLTLVKYTPTLETILSESDHLEVDMSLQGEFIDMQTFLLDLCQLPYLKRIKTLQIQSEADLRQIHLTIWLAQE